MRKRVYASSGQRFSKKAKKAGKKASVVARTFRRPATAASFDRLTPATVGGTSMRTTLIYCENGFTLNPGVGGAASAYVFDLNSLFDPNVSGVGHQPSGYDQLMSIYEEYIVYGASYKVSMFNSDASAEAIHGVTVTDQLAVSADCRVYIENGNTHWKLSSRVAGSGPGITEFSGYVDLPKLHGMTMTEYLASDQYQGTIAASPTERGFLHCWAGPANASTDIGDQVVYVEITYFCLLSGGKLNALS